MTTTCDAPTTSGPCRYPAALCPLHASPAPAEEAPEENSDPHTLIRLALEAAARGEASTVHLERLARTLDALERRSSPWTDSERYRLAYMIGKIMHGIPPRDVAEWELAREYYTDESLQEYAAWAHLDPGASEPDWVDKLRDPTNPRFAWRFEHPLGPWNHLGRNVEFRINECYRGFDAAYYSDVPPVWTGDPADKPVDCVLPPEPVMRPGQEPWDEPWDRPGA